MLDKKDIKNYIGRKTNFKTATYLLKTNGFKQIYFQEFTKADKKEYFCIFEKNKIFIFIETKDFKVYKFQVYMELYSTGKFASNWNKMSEQKGLCLLRGSSPISFSAIINFPYDTFNFIKTWETEVVGSLNKAKFPSVLTSTEPKASKNLKFNLVFDAFPQQIQEMFH